VNKQREIRIHVPVLARVEGEGALDLLIKEDTIESLKLKIYEPPRMFEKFLEGRDYHEVPDMVARICGICPVAYQMSAIQALEAIFEMEAGPWVHDMRRVFYCGEWVQSHSLHIHLLAAPDFLGFSSAVQLAEKYPEEVRRGLRLQALGNDLIALLGGRSVHPVGACVGGFHKAPTQAQVTAILERLQTALPEAQALVQWTAALELPDDEQEFVTVSLNHTEEYPMIGERLISSDGMDIPIEQYEQHFKEFQVPHSTALHASLHDHPFLVGPLARLNLNHQQLPGTVLENLLGTGVHFPSKNMFHSIVARAVEIHYAVVEAIRLLENYHEPHQPCADVPPRAGIGYGCSEAPRGVLWHCYQTDDSGCVTSARIVPPTSQNQARIEQDLRNSLQNFGLDHDEDQLRLHAETVVRNYDPCISCATHFLRVKVSRAEP